MQTSVILVTLLTAIAPLVWGKAPLFRAQEKAPDSYIVVLKVRFELNIRISSQEISFNNFWMIDRLSSSYTWVLIS